MKYALLLLLSLLAPAAGAAQSPALTMGPPLTAHAVGAAPHKNVRGSPQVLVYDSFTGATTLTTTTGSPRTFMGFPFNLGSAGGSTPMITSATAYLAYTGAAEQTYNSLRVRLQLWNGWSSAATPVFSAPESLLVFDVAGPVTLSPNTFTPITLTFPVPTPMTALTERGLTINFQGDTGAGLANADALTSLLRAGPPIAVGSNALAPTLYGYRNVAGQTDFNFVSTDARGFSSLENQGTAFQLFVAGTPLIPQTITNFIAAPSTPTISDGSFAVSATGGPSGNPVTFSIAPVSAAVCTAGGTNGASITILSAGTCTVLADQAGDATHSAAAQQTLDVTITAGNLTITPATVAFADQAAGTTSPASTVTLANTGDGALDVTGLTEAAAPFARTGGTCSNTLPITLAAGTQCTLDYTFAPTAAGTSNQSLTVTANAPGSGTIELSGTGVQGNLTITPTTLVFADQTIETTSPPGAVTLANTGSAPLQVTALTPAAAPFALAGGTCTLPITIAAGADCTLLYTFAPSAPGAASQQIDITTNAPGSGMVLLSGTGVAAPRADVAVTIDDGRSVAGIGETLDYVIVISNNDGPTTVDVTVEDTLPAGLADGLWDCIASGPGAICASGTGDTLDDVATLPAGTSATYVFSATVQPGSEAMEIENKVTVAVSSAPDPNLGNNTATDVTLISNPIFADGFEALP